MGARGVPPRSLSLIRLAVALSAIWYTEIMALMYSSAKPYLRRASRDLPEHVVVLALQEINQVACLDAFLLARVLAFLDVWVLDR